MLTVLLIGAMLSHERPEPLHALACIAAESQWQPPRPLGPRL